MLDKQQILICVHKHEQFVVHVIILMWLAGKRSSSAKVFSALSWSWSSKSLQVGKDSTTSGAVEPCRPGAHCSTLEKLYTAEKKLYQLVRVRAC